MLKFSGSNSSLGVVLGVEETGMFKVKGKLVDQGKKNVSKFQRESSYIGSSSI